MPSRIDTLISDCASWAEFRELASRQKIPKDKGDLFERLTQIYLQTHPTYRSKIKNVWWCNNGELPEQIRRKLNLPETDEGIDLLCETYEGEYWSVQSKYQTNSDIPLNHKKLSTFLSLSFVTAIGISTGLVVHTSTKKVRKSHLMGNTVELGLQHWLDINDDQWDQILEICRGNVLEPPEKRDIRKYQELAIECAKEHFLKNKNKRGKLIMPCGTGKSLIAYWAAQALKVKIVIVALPSLALVKQSLEDWTSEYLAEGVHPEWMAVCSDDSVGKMREADSTVATVYEAGIPTTTDPLKIVDFVQKKSKNPKVIFTTYQSSPKLADACKQQDLTIDLLIADEAHKTVGRRDKKFATLLFDENIEIKQRLFMTATERVYRQGSENIASMDNENIYGKIFHQMTFKQAIDNGIICDYKILTVAVSGSEVANLLAEHTEVTAQLGNQKVETDAHNMAAGIAIEKVFEKHKIKHALSFHRSIKRAEDFNKQQDAFSGKLGSKLLIENRNISSKLSAGQRSQLLTDFTASERSLISNARCLTEGVDIPSIDCVTFVDPKQSTVDIVQAAGRAMRQSKETGKTHGYILIPIIVPDGQDLDQFAESTDFAALARVITSLSTQDERIVDELRHREPGQPSNPDDIIIVDPDIIESLDVDYQTFNDAVSTRIWASVGRANFISYMEAREQIKPLGIKSETEWRKRDENNVLLYNIPKAPHSYYLGKGWISWQHFLSKKTVVHYEFSVAKEKSLAMRCVSQADWKRKTSSIDEFPSNPEKTYSEDGWNGWSDFLGTPIIATNVREYLTFEECRQFMVEKKIKTKTQFDKQKADFPINIPRAPQHKYSETGFKNWPHFLSQNDTDFLNYNEAKTLIQPMCLKSANEYREKFSKRELPDRLPSNPSQKYKDKGWESWGEFLGKTNFLSFSEATRRLKAHKLTSLARYKELIDEGILNKADFPRAPQKVYKKEWTGTKDYLGDNSRYAWRPFVEARKWVHEQKISGQKGWYELCKKRSFPEDIPKSPWIAYSKDGWINLTDWLGNE